MRKLMAALIVAGAMLAPAASFAGTVENGYGNTFVVTSASGVSLRYHFNEDGTFAVTAPDGQTASGTYTVSGDQLCMTQNGQEGCVAVQADKNVGDSWEQTGADGSPITVTLEAGR
ncbi:MAG: hypothetical protein R3C16_11260 [Hyphomonadaceae bacterium]